MEWKKGNTFGTTAFTSFGFFWIILVTLLILPSAGLTEGSGGPVAMAFFLSVWGFFALSVFLGTLQAKRAIQFVFATVTILFLLLAAAYALERPTITVIAGYEGILCGASAMYVTIAQVLNESYG